MRFAHGVQRGTAALDAVFVGDGGQLALLIGNIQRGDRLFRARAADLAAVEQEGDFVRVGVNVGLDRLAQIFVVERPGVQHVVPVPAGAGEALAVVLGMRGENARLGASDPHGLAEVGLRTAVAAQVEIALIAGAPGVFGQADARNEAIARPQSAARARLAQVVIGRPGEIADDVIVLQHGVPGIIEADGVRLAAPDDAVRIEPVIGGVMLELIVVAHDVQRRHVALRPVEPAGFHAALTDVGMTLQKIALIVLGIDLFGIRPHAAHAGGDEAGGIIFADLGAQLFRPERAVRIAVALADFVAYGIADHAGVIAVAQHHGGYVARPPVGEPEMVVHAGLLLAPHIERLVHDQHADAVTHLEQRQRGRVVGDAHGVEAGLFEQRELALLSRRERRRAQHAVIVMDAAAAHLQGLAVQPEAVNRVGFDGADAERRLRLVGQNAVRADFGLERVERGGVNVPQLRMID